MAMVFLKIPILPQKLTAKKLNKRNNPLNFNQWETYE